MLTNTKGLYQEIAYNTSMICQKRKNVIRIFPQNCPLKSPIICNKKNLGTNPPNLYIKTIICILAHSQILFYVHQGAMVTTTVLTAQKNDNPVGSRKNTSKPELKCSIINMLAQSQTVLTVHHTPTRPNHFTKYKLNQPRDLCAMIKGLSKSEENCPYLPYCGAEPKSILRKSTPHCTSSLYTV